MKNIVNNKRASRAARPSAGKAVAAELRQRESRAALPPVAVTWAQTGAESLARRFGMDEHSVALRRQFVRLGAGERELLWEMAPWAQSVAAHMAKDFYDWQFDFGPTREFFETFAREHSMPLAALRKRLEAAQTGYLTEVFAGASIDWDLRYFEKRLHVGEVHDRINLPFKWYVGAYPEYNRLLAAYLRRDFQDEEKIREIEAAVQKVFNLDLQAIGDAFILNTLQNMLQATGITLERATSSGDKAEQVGTIKQVINKNMESFVAAMKHMSDEHDKGDIDVIIPPEKFEGAYRVMAEAVNEMVMGHIAVKRKTMACVAEFGKGNFKAPLERFPGKKAFINETIELMRTNLTSLISETAENAAALTSSSEELTAVSQQMAGNAEETATQANVVSAASEQVSQERRTVASARGDAASHPGDRQERQRGGPGRDEGRDGGGHDQRDGRQARRIQRGDRQGDQGDHLDRAADQPAGAERHDRGGARRRGRQGLRGGRQRGQGAGQADGQGDRGHRPEDRGDPGRHQGRGRGDRRDRRDHQPDQRHLEHHRLGGGGADGDHQRDRPQRRRGGNRGATRSPENISGVATAARSTTEGANDTQMASQQMSQMAARLQKAVSKFTI